MQVDESTDCSKNKGLAINVRFVDPDTCYVQCRFLDMVPVFEKGQVAKATAERLFQCIVQSFADCEIPIGNIFACCFDGCSTMTGEQSGLKARLKEAIPGIVCIQCPAHSTHLCASHAASDEVPQEIMVLNTNIYGMLNSSHKLHDYALLQEMLEIPMHKILKTSSTRWLALEANCDRVIEQFPGLIEFSKDLAEKKDTNAKQVYALLTAVDTKCYFLMMKHVLSELNALNRLYQRCDVILHKVGREVEKRFKNIVSVFMNRTYVLETPASEIDIYDESKYLRFSEFELGEEVNKILLSNGDEMESFCKNAYNFAISIAYQMQERFSYFMNEIYDAVDCLSTEHATCNMYRQKFPQKFDDLLKLFHILVTSEEMEMIIKKEWDNLINIEVPEYYLLTQTIKIEDFWSYLLRLVDESGNYMFSNVASFALLVLATPHGNADPERTFSAQNNLKTKNRNKMEVETVGAVLRAKQAVDYSLNRVLIPSDDMINSVLKSRYYKNKYAEAGVI